MSRPLRTCLYNPDSEMPLHQPFDSIKNAHIMGQWSTWEELKEEIRHGGIDLVVVNLDSETGLSVVKCIVTTAPACGIIGIGSKADPSSIIKAMRAGCGQFVTWPVDVHDLQEAVDRIKVTHTSVSRDSQRICVVGSSGGAGATTIACNLAIELANLVDQRCAIVDMNLELGDVDCFFDYRPVYSVADVCAETVVVDSRMLSRALHDLHCNVSILVRPERMEEAHAVTCDGVASLFEVAREMFPYVIVDLPRSFSVIRTAALQDAQRVLIITQLSVASVRNATRIYESLCQMNVPEEKIEIVLNRCKSEFMQITPENVEAHFGKPVLGMIPNDYRRIQSSLDLGNPLTSAAPSSPARLAIHEIARKIASNQLTDDHKSAPSQTFLGRLWKRSVNVTLEASQST